MNWGVALFILCSASGMVMVIGSLFLLWKGRIVLDNRGKKMTRAELPLGIKLSTEFPVLVMFLFGAFLLSFPIYYSKNISQEAPCPARVCPEMLTVTGTIKSPVPMNVYAVIGEQSSTNDVIISVPFVRNSPYRILASDPSGILKPIANFKLDKFIDTYKFTPNEFQAPSFSPPDVPEKTLADPNKVKDFKD